MEKTIEDEGILTLNAPTAPRATQTADGKQRQRTGLGGISKPARGFSGLNGKPNNAQVTLASGPTDYQYNVEGVDSTIYDSSIGGNKGLIDIKVQNSHE